MVVGSGFGGAVAACRLAQAGFSVLVLERGRRVQPGDFPPLPGEESFAPSVDPFTIGGGGVYDVRDLGGTFALQASGYGGGSLVYAGVHLRPPAGIFERWPDGLRKPQLDEHFDLAAYMLDVAPIDDFPFPLPRKTRAFDAAVEAAGREAFHPPLTQSRRSGTNAFGATVEACNGCGSCALGCSRGAKNSLDQNYLALAESYENVTVRTRANVRAVHAVDESAYDVEFVDGLCGDQERRVRARFVFLGAGVVGTHEILARSRECSQQTSGDGLPRLSPRVGDGFFTNNDDASMVFSRDESLAIEDGPTITSSIVHHSADGGLVLVQDGGLPAELSRVMTTIYTSPALLGRNRHGRDPWEGAWREQSRARDTAEQQAAEAAAVELVDRLLASDLSPSGLEQLVLAWLTGTMPDVAPPQLRAAFGTLRDQLIETSRPNFARAIDSLLEHSASQVVDRLTLGRLARFPGLRTRLVDNARKLGELLIADRDGLIDRAQQSFFRHFLLVEPEREIRRRLADYLMPPTNPGQLFLLSMGTDTTPARLEWDADASRGRLAQNPGAFQESSRLARRIKRDVSEGLGGQLRTHPITSVAGRGMTVHAQGGAAIGEDSDRGVVDRHGEVFGHPGLFVVDASVFPAPVGVNPSATILALAERNVLAFIRTQRGAAWPLGDESPGARQFHKQLSQARDFAESRLATFHLEPPAAPVGGASPEPTAQPIGVRFTERFRGFLAAGSASPAYVATDDYCTLEIEVMVDDLDGFFADPLHAANVRGRFVGAGMRDAEVHGRLLMYPDAERCDEEAATDGLRYELSLREASGAAGRLVLDKPMRGARFRALEIQRSTMQARARLEVDGRTHVGRLDVDGIGFLTEQLPSLEITGTEEPAQIAWAMLRFGEFFFHGLLPGARRSIESRVDQAAQAVSFDAQEEDEAPIRKLSG